MIAHSISSVELILGDQLPASLQLSKNIRGPCRPSRKIMRLRSAAPERGPGDNRARTGNLRRAKAALSQLSYVPRRRLPDVRADRVTPRAPAREAIGAADALGLAGVEPATSRLSGVRSNQLSYRPAEAAAEDRVFVRPMQTQTQKTEGEGCKPMRIDPE
jgi:hypothetical protein